MARLLCTQPWALAAGQGSCQPQGGFYTPLQAEADFSHPQQVLCSCQGLLEARSRRNTRLISQDVRASPHGTWQLLLCPLCSVSERGRNKKKQTIQNANYCSAGWAGCGKQSVIQGTERLTKSEFKTSPSPALWAHVAALGSSCWQRSPHDSGGVGMGSRLPLQ